MRLQFDRVYCVSLPRSTDRRQHATRELTTVGWGNFQFFDATDQDSPLVAEYRERGLVATFPPCFRCGQRVCECLNNVLIDPQIATFITFKRLWEEIVRDDVGVALVVEDDIKFTDYAPELIRNALTPANLQACSMTRDSAALLRLGWAKSPEHVWSNEFQFLRGAVRMANPAFALTRAMAGKLLQDFTAINCTADTYIHRKVGSDCVNHTLIPPLSYELSHSTGEFDSLIRSKTIRAQYLRQTQPENTAAISAAEQASRAQIVRIEPRDILCMGHPRCGSAYMAHLLQAFGLDVGHEQLGSRGISSWMFAVDDDPYPFARNRGAERRRDKHFSAVIQHVRDPADAIPSIMVENRHSSVSYQFRRRHILKGLGIDLESYTNELERAVVAYLAWNQLIEQLKPQLVVPVENAEVPLRQWLVNQGLVAAEFQPNALPPRDVNTRKRYQGRLVDKPQVLAADWAKLPLATSENLQLFCDRHGYPFPG